MSKRSIEISKDNFDSAILSFLRATTVIADNEEAKLVKFKLTNEDTYTLTLTIAPIEHQLRLPL